MKKMSGKQKKMKLAIVLLVFVGATIAAKNESIKEDVKEVIRLLPVEKIRELIKKYLDNDGEVRRFVAYLKGSDWIGLVRQLREETNPDFKKFLLDAGIDFESIGGKILHRVEENQQLEGGNGRSGNALGIKAFFAELDELVSGRETLNLLMEKLQKNAEFKELYAKLSGEEGRNYLDEFRAMRSTQNIISAIKEWGFDLNKAFDAYYKFLGFN